MDRLQYVLFPAELVILLLLHLKPWNNIIQKGLHCTLTYSFVVSNKESVFCVRGKICLLRLLENGKSDKRSHRVTSTPLKSCCSRQWHNYSFPGFLSEVSAAPTLQASVVSVQHFGARGGRVKVKQRSQDGVNSTRQQSPHTKLTHEHEKVSEMKSTRSGEC